LTKLYIAWTLLLYNIFMIRSLCLVARFFFSN